MAKNKMKEVVDATETAHELVQMNKEVAPAVPVKSTPIVFADLPLISTLPRPQMDRAKELLEELDTIKQINQMNKDREEELEEELEGIQRGNKLLGLRWGQWCFAWRMMPGRKTLKEEKLIEAGVSADIIERCKVPGKDFAKREFRDLGVLGRGTGPARIE